MRVVVVGNKLDMHAERVVPKDKGLEYACSIDAQFAEVSAKDNSDRAIQKLMTAFVDDVMAQKYQRQTEKMIFMRNNQ